MEDGSTRYCKGCHALLPPQHGKGRPRKYCSRACQQAARQTINLERLRPTCATCGAPLTRHKKYCSPECRAKRATPWATHLTWRDCAICETPFIVRGQRKKTCGRPACQASNNQQNMRRTNRAAEYVDGKRICPDCQRPYEPTPGTRLCPECSAWKAELARIGRKTSVAIEVRRCPICGELFVVRASSSRETCRRRACVVAWSRTTYRRTASRHAHLYNDDGTQKKCVDCGEWYEPYMGCSSRCRPCAVRHAKESNDARKRQKQYGERGGLPVLYSYIMKRDGWRCYLCGGRIDSRLSYPHRMSGSLDHTIPFSLGGTYTRENIRGAHLDCNRKKHTNAMNEQLMLIG